MPSQNDRPTGGTRAIAAADNRPTPPVIRMLQQMEPQIKAALPSIMRPDRMIRLATTALRQVPKLLNCDPQSVIGKIVESAQLGLEPNTALGHCWLIPFGRECQLIIGYKGFIALAFRAGFTLIAEVVYEKDMFKYRKGSDPFIEHVPYSGDEERGAIKYSYAVAHFTDGRRPLFYVCDHHDIDKAKQSSSAWQRGQRDPNKRDSPWYTNEEPMWKKTAIRRLSPYVPMSPEMARAIELDAQAEEGTFQSVDVPFELPTDPAEETKNLEARFDAAKANLQSAQDAAASGTAGGSAEQGSLLR